MSRFSGVCDLYDCMMLQGKDEMESFLDFKRRTGGVMYQFRRIDLPHLEAALMVASNPRNGLKAVERVERKKDGRRKDGFREEVNYSFEYQGRRYADWQSLNEAGVRAQYEIRFSTLLDLIPYYPYECSMASSPDSLHVDLAEKSELDRMRDSDVCNGRLGATYATECLHRLQWHYEEAVNKYYDPKGRTETREFEIEHSSESPTVDVRVEDASLDPDWEVKVKRDRHEWIMSAPKIANAKMGIIDVTNVWPGELKDGDRITLTYVKSRECAIRTDVAV